MQQIAIAEIGAIEARLKDNLRLIEAMLADRRQRPVAVSDARVLIDAIQEKRQRFQNHFPAITETSASPAA